MSRPNVCSISRWRAVLASALGLLLVSTTVSAQSVVNPTVAEFVPSPDHNTVVNGTSVVSRYDLGFYLLGAALPLQTQSLGKPVPGSDGRIRVPLSTLTTLLAAIPSLGLTYEARVTAVGPAGATLSAVSNPFTFTTLCTRTVSSTTQSIGASGGTGSVGVTAGCGWTAVSNVSWITITAGASGSGNGTVTYSVAANPSTSPRSGTLSVAGSTVTVTQAGTACSFTVSPTAQTIGATGGSVSATVSAGSGCSWTSSESLSWLSITAGTSGSGNGTVTYSVAANTESSPRSGTLSVAGQAVTVSQNAAASCAVTLASGSVVFGLAGGTGSVAVSAAGNCQWTAASNANWLTVTGGTPGRGNGTVRFSVSTMSPGAPRVAAILIGSQTFSVTQGTPPVAPTGVRVTEP